MITPFFIPPANIVPQLDRRTAVSLRTLLEAAGCTCRASGRWTERSIVLVEGEQGLLEREPGDWAAVRIGHTAGLSPQQAARYAAALLAYGLMDPVARESIKGKKWCAISAPAGRPRRGAAQTNAERQRLHRARKSQAVASVAQTTRQASSVASRRSTA